MIAIYKDDSLMVETLKNALYGKADKLELETVKEVISEMLDNSTPINYYKISNIFNSATDGNRICKCDSDFCKNNKDKCIKEIGLNKKVKYILE